MKKNFKRTICFKCSKEFRNSNFNRHFKSCVGPKPKRKLPWIDYDPSVGYKNGTRKTWNKGLSKEDIIAKGYKVGGVKSFNDEDVFIQNSSYSRGNLKKRIIKNNIIAYECSECVNIGIWRDKPLSLHLDHINGIFNDHRRENLRFLCPNCHSQTISYAGKRKSYKS